MTRVVSGTSPLFSPDRRRLAFARNREYVGSADATGAVPLVPGVVAAWSPDSRALASIVVGQRIAVVRADGGGRRTLTHAYADILEVEWRR